MAMPEIYVIGIDGASPLSARAGQCLDQAGVVLASRRLEGLFSRYPEHARIGRKLRVIDSISDTIAFLADADAPCAVLASGDPLFFGIGSKIIDALTGLRVEVLPAISSPQLAFARTRLPWHDAVFVSLHGRVRREWDSLDIPLLASRHPKLALLTGGENTPAAIAALLPPMAMVHVLERIGYEDERTVSGPPSEIAVAEFREPNLMIVLTPDARTPVFGLRESSFRHERGLITKDEVRAVALHKLGIPPRGVLWDVGAGSGSVSIEAKRLSPALDVHAIEKNPERARAIEENARALAAGKICVVCAAAPEALAGLPAPDRVFIGGAGSALPEIIRSAASAMAGGVLVISTVTLESVSEAVRTCESLGLAPEVASLAVGRSSSLQGRHYLKAENQVFLIRGIK